MTAETRPLSALIPYAKNARRHSDDQVNALMASLLAFGWTIPVLIDADGGLIAGHGRIMAAAKLYELGETLVGLDGEKIPAGAVPVLVARGWSEAKKRAYIIADNKLAEGSIWDRALLREEVQALALEDIDLGPIGFSDGELGALLSSGSGVGADDALSEWVGMPEFEQDATPPHRSLIVHFRNEADVQAFGKLVAQGFSEKAKFIWFPEDERARFREQRWVDAAAAPEGAGQ